MDLGVIFVFLGMTAVIGAMIYLIGLALLRKKAPAPNDLVRVADATLAYFRASDVDAKVDCVFVPGKGLVALVEVDPQERFRSSYIIEQTLKEQILRITGKHLVEVYWRFPMIDKLPPDTAHAGPAFAAMKSAKQDPNFDIGETSWDEYERALSRAAGNEIRKDGG